MAEPLGLPRDQRGMSALAVTDHLFLQFAVGFALCALASGLILAGRLSIRRTAESEAWPAVDGIVIESTVAAKRAARDATRTGFTRYPVKPATLRAGSSCRSAGVSANGRRWNKVTPRNSSN